MTARAGAALAAFGLLASLSLVGWTDATTAQAKRGDAKAPPGRAKKLQPEAISEQPPHEVESHVRGKVKAPKPQKVAKAKPPKAPKPNRPPKARGPTRDTPPVAAPSQSEPQVPATAPAPAAATPRTATPRRSARPGRRRTTAEPRRTAGEPAKGAIGAPLAASLGDAVRVAATGEPANGGAQTSKPDADKRDKPSGDGDKGSVVTRTVRDIVEVVPDRVKLALAALAALSLLLAGGYLASALRARSLVRQRHELLGEVGLLQSALLPPVPDKLGALRTSVAYRPADGLGAGGDFYDALPLSGGRAGFILGDISGHGRAALERTAFMRYTLRAYLEAGLEPRFVLQVAGRVIGESLGGEFATVLIAVHDPRNGSLTYASAGHPAPIVIGGDRFEPVLAGSSPPIGVGVPTGLRQTTVPLMPGATACLYTDGLTEARTEDGLLGDERLEQLLEELGPEATAAELIERVAEEAHVASDDMATCLLSPTAGVTTGGFRTEQLELSAEEIDGPLVRRFLQECDVAVDDRERAAREARDIGERSGGGAMLSVVFGSRRTVEVLPRNVESIEAAASRAAASA